MARLRMEVSGTERVAELMEETVQKTVELQKITEQLTSAICQLRLSGTLEHVEDSNAVTPEMSVRGITVEIPSSSSRDTPPEAGANTLPKT